MSVSVYLLTVANCQLGTEVGAMDSEKERYGISLAVPEESAVNFTETESQEVPVEDNPIVSSCLIYDPLLRYFHCPENYVIRRRRN